MVKRRCGWWSRALAVLALVAAVVAMHGLATGHHGATASPLLTAALTVSHTVDEHPHTAAIPTVAAAGVAVVAAAGQHDCDGACQGGEHALGLLCVAVLLAAGVGVLALRQRTGLLTHRSRPPQRVLARAPAPPRPPDLVAELCISRT